MRIVLVLICSLALACVAAGAQKEQKEAKPAPKKKQAQASQPAGKPGGKPATSGKPYTTGKPAGAGKPAKAGKAAHAGKPAAAGNTAAAGMSPGKSKGKGKGKPAEAGKVAGAGADKPAKVGKATGAGKPGEGATATAGKTAAKGKAAGKPLKPQHFNLPKQANTAKAPPVKFQQGRRIEGSQNWQGQHYTVFRNYRSEWHDQGWWHSHYPRVVFSFGSPYYWNSGYWFPAWGYNSNAYYPWDGPIYAYNDLPPDQVIANVQAALQQQGYYRGEVDGLIGPLTREAIANYQRDHGLYTTSTIDRPTLESLGMA
jgi:Putative peptidoglycan binding domain